MVSSLKVSNFPYNFYTRRAGILRTKGVVFIEFFFVTIVLFICFYLFLLAGLFFSSHTNALYVARGFYNTIRSSNFPYNTPNLNLEIRFVEPNEQCNSDQFRCVVCSSNYLGTNILENTLCLLKNSASDWYWILKPRSIVLRSTQMTSQELNLGVIFTVATNFTVDNFFAQVFNLNNVVISITGFSL